MATAELDVANRPSSRTLRRRSLYRDATRRFFRNRLSIVGLIIVSTLLFVAIFADDWFIAPFLGRPPQPLIAHYAYDEAFVGPTGAFPSADFWMGADLNGRDVWSRIVYGARISLSIAILSQLFALLIGLPMGALAGWRGGKVDYAIMRFVDIMSALPVLLLAFLIMLRMGASYWNVLLALSLTTWIEICRLTRGQFLTLREKEFVEASRAIGSRTPRIVFGQILPNALAPITDAQLGADDRARGHRQHDLLLAPRPLPGDHDRADDARLYAGRRRAARCVGSKDGGRKVNCEL
jgi:ABC-type dipeptide/oligopeptide/nickel transport system permease subunit